MSETKVLHEWSVNGKPYRLVEGGCEDCGLSVEDWWIADPAEGDQPSGWDPVHEMCPSLPELARLADLLRPRDPRVELPGEWEEVVAQHQGGVKRCCIYDASRFHELGGLFISEAAGWTGHSLLAWWPAPQLEGSGS